MNIWLAVVLIILALVGGIVIGFFLSKKYMENYLQENPPVDEDFIRAMMGQMGQKPSEARVRQMTTMMKSQNKKKKKSKK
ncbi:MAG: YneF family protein [Atopococcus tabaci]|uniref:UPF0154 protein Q4F26_00220 n=1 Tax=Atopococcus tabaci TaxID=269774 RepID=A0AA43UA11_9LACT|nr:YneF family protein [Atopococcus tabaci]